MTKRFFKGLVLVLLIIVSININPKANAYGKEDTYTVSFYANSGSGTMSKQKIKYNERVKLNTCQYYKKGYSFSGWAKTRTGKVIYDNKSYVKNIAKPGENIKLYAKWKEEGERRALILGETSTFAVPMLDVTSMESLMSSCMFYGEKMSKVVSYPNHTKKEITSKIKKLFSENSSNDISYIYITCHGDDEGNIYIGSDGEAYSTAELKKVCNQYIKGKVVLLIDCCYSGSAITKQINFTKQINLEGDNFSEKFIKDFFNDDSNDKSGELATSKYKVICSSSKRETSSGGIASLATKYWELGSGWNEVNNKKCTMYADQNNDNMVTLDELYKYSYKRVLKENPKQHIQVYPKNSAFVIFGKYK